jgi:glycerophosphoryl diester phosphodiesterase
MNCTLRICVKYLFEMTKFKYYMKTVLLSSVIFFSLAMMAQPARYSAANIHSHNDYKQIHPFFTAWNNEVGSLEADIILLNGKLMVAHQLDELDTANTLERLYLDALQSKIDSNQGHPYADRSRKLILLIDIKSEAASTLRELVNVLQHYAGLTHCPQLRLVITGNRPPDDQFASYPSFIYFDGLPGKKYTGATLKKIAMVSANLADFTNWNGNDKIPASDLSRLQTAIKMVHASGKPVRFWNAPDFDNAWKQLMEIGVDYINTDRIEPLRQFLDHQ